MNNSTDRLQKLESLIKQQIVVMDGAMGTMIQQHKLEEFDFRGIQFANHSCDVKGNNDLRMKHQERAATLKKCFTDAGIPIMPSVTHIVPVLVRDPVLCKLASDELLYNHDIYVQPINYPTVPRGTERLRFTPTPLHDDQLMEQLVKAMKEVWGQLGLEAAA